MDALLHYFAGTSQAVSVKLLSSVDDILWLSTFLTPNLSIKTRINNALVYTAVCLLQTCLAFLISTGGEAAIDELLKKHFGENRVSSDKLLTLISGTVLGIYAVVLGVTYYQEEIIGRNDEDVGYNSIPLYDATNNAAKNNEENVTVETVGDGKTSLILGENSGTPKTEFEFDVFRSCSLSSEEETNAKNDSTKIEPFQIDIDYRPDVGKIDLKELTMKEENESETSSSSSLFVIAFIGSLDDLTLFVPLLVGKTFHIFELISGAMIAVLIILCFCFFLVRCKIVSDFLQKIPLCVIVLIFSIIILVKGIMMV